MYKENRMRDNYYTLAVASDHAGFELKGRIVNYLKAKSYILKDLGTNNAEPVDYPDYAGKVSDAVLEKEARFGLLICGTGIGMSIAANRRAGIRAALCTNVFMAERARAHNDANILVSGAKIVDFETLSAIIEKFLHTDFEGGRHLIRLEKI